MWASWKNTTRMSTMLERLVEWPDVITLGTLDDTVGDVHLPLFTSLSDKVDTNGLPHEAYQKVSILIDQECSNAYYDHRRHQ